MPQLGKSKPAKVIKHTHGSGVVNVDTHRRSLPKSLKKSEAAIRGWVTRYDRYGPSGRSYYKRASKYRRREVKR